MKQLSTFLSILALIGVGILFYFHFSAAKASLPAPATPTEETRADFRIAYFDIDSLQDKYEYFKDVSDKIKNREANVTAQLNTLQNNFQKRLRELQEKGPTMSQSEGEAAQREYAQMQQKYQQQQMTMEQDLKKHQIEMMTDVRTKIENYLKEYNKQKGYAFILSYEPGFMLYYRDSVYDITHDVIVGLNDQYRKEKK